MINYIIRRIGYGILILIGVNLFTFMSSIRACARRSFDAATSSRARVIFRVFCTERMRRRMSC